VGGTTSIAKDESNCLKKTNTTSFSARDSIRNSSGEEKKKREEKEIDRLEGRKKEGKGGREGEGKEKLKSRKKSIVRVGKKEGHGPAGVSWEPG